MDVDAANLVVACLTAVGGWYSGKFAERRAFRLGASTFAADWFRDLRSWSSEAIDVLSEAIHSTQTEGDATALKSYCARLSALIDRGRFFLPNASHDQFGKHKPTAFRGLRHPAVDYLVAAYDITNLAPLPTGLSDRRSALVEIKREFVSVIQDILDPRSQNRLVAELIAATLADPTEKRTALERLQGNGSLEKLRVPE